MTAGELLQLFSIGIAAGIVLSVIPFIIGLVIDLPFKIMKGG